LGVPAGGSSLLRPGEPLRASGSRDAVRAGGSPRAALPDGPALRRSDRAAPLRDSSLLERRAVTDERPPLLVILGGAGAGKSAAAHEVALRLGGEIVSADAFAVYRGFDVGTAKPSREERAQVPYHAIDVADPGETFSAGRWAREARPIIESIAARGRLPIVCGGGGGLLGGRAPGRPARAGAGRRGGGPR